MSETIQNKKTIEEQQEKFQNATITVTESAVKRLKSVMTSDGKENHILRMSVEGGGCSGMTYKMDFENKNPISLLIVPKSDNELSLFSISFFYF